MPDRLIRSAILTSDRVNALSWGAEVFYRRLMSVADDFGRYDGRTAILRSALYPLKIDRVSESDIGKWIRECGDADLVRLYAVDGKDFLEILRFNQRLRASASKWPNPPANADIGGQMPAQVSGPPPYSNADAEALLAAASPPAEEPRLLPGSMPGERGSLFVALAIACGSKPESMTNREAKACESALREILAAAPALTESLIVGSAAAYKARYRDMALTPNALARHWSECAVTKNHPPCLPPIKEPAAGWRQRFSEGYPHHHLADESRPWRDISRDNQKVIIGLLSQLQHKTTTDAA